MCTSAHQISMMRTGAHQISMTQNSMCKTQYANAQHTTLNTQHTTQYSTHNTQHSTRNTRHAAGNRQHAAGDRRQEQATQHATFNARTQHTITYPQIKLVHTHKPTRENQRTPDPWRIEVVITYKHTTTAILTITNIPQAGIETKEGEKTPKLRQVGAGRGGTNDNNNNNNNNNNNYYYKTTTKTTITLPITTIPNTTQ